MIITLQTYSIPLVRKLVEENVGQNLDDFMLQFQKTPLEESRHGKLMTLGDYKIRNGATLLLLKVGITLNITNPQVQLERKSTGTINITGYTYQTGLKLNRIKNIKFYMHVLYLS